MTADTTDEALQEKLGTFLYNRAIGIRKGDYKAVDKLDTEFLSLIHSREQALSLDASVPKLDQLISNVMGTNKKAWLERPSHKDSRHKYVRADVGEQRYIDGLWESRNYIASQRIALATIKGEEK